MKEVDIVLKKSAVVALLCVTIAFMAFVAGYYVGRNYHRDPIQVLTTTPSLTPTTTPNDTNATTPSAPETTTQAVLININTATLAELTTLPYIGEAKAQAIIDYREEFGPFQTVEDLLYVPGIGEKTLAKFIHLITVGG